MDLLGEYKKLLLIMSTFPQAPWACFTAMVKKWKEKEAAYFVTAQITVGNSGGSKVVFGTGTRLFVEASKFLEIA